MGAFLSINHTIAEWGLFAPRTTLTIFFFCPWPFQACCNVLFQFALNMASDSRALGTGVTSQ